MTKNGALRAINGTGLTERDYERSRARLTKQWKREPSPADVAWAAMNDAVTRTKDLRELKSIFFAKALFLHREGRDSYDALRMALECELHLLQHTGIVKEVRIDAKTGCEVCKRQHNRLLTIRQALKTMPLPCKGCTTKLYDLEAEHGYCRCSYLPELD